MICNSLALPHTVSCRLVSLRSEVCICDLFLIQSAQQFRVDLKGQKNEAIP
jgi:hypothetical protein